MDKNELVALFSAGAANLGVDLLAPVKRVLDSSWYVLGEEVAAFEREFASYVDVNHCVTVANGTDALEIALRGLGVGPGDLIATVANAGFYSSAATHAVGATPLYVDIGELRLTIDVEALSIALKNKPKCVIVTHLYGQMADMDLILAATRAAGVPIIEDCAQAHGAHRLGRKAGSWGDVACFSFYPTKNLGALGDGGAIVTNDSDLAARLRALRQYGWSEKYKVTTAGGRNSRLDEMQAAVLREKLPHLDGWNAERRRIAILYNDAFQNLPIFSMPQIGDDYVAHLYVIQVENRDSFRSFLRRRGVVTDVHYPVPDFLQTAYPDARVVGAMQATLSACSRVVTLPCFPGMTDSQISQVISSVVDYFEL